MSFATLVALVATMGIPAGCGDDDDPIPGIDPGMGMASDAGVSVPDASNMPPDASTMAPDASTMAQDASEPPDASGSSDASGSPDAGVVARCPDPMAPACQDEAFELLTLRDVEATGLIVEEGTVPGEQTYIDATGGGIMIPEAYVYARFTPNGLEKLDLTDEEAFESSDWHIAFRRFVIRLNGGAAGPSCVQGARLPGDPDFESVTEVPADLTLRQEAYFTDSCELITDVSGLPNAPGTVLASYWEYSDLFCLKMTGNVFVVELPDGQAVKLEVLSYYNPESQEECQNDEPFTGERGSANLRVRWAFL